MRQQIGLGSAEWFFCWSIIWALSYMYLPSVAVCQLGSSDSRHSWDYLAGVKVMIGSYVSDYPASPDFFTWFQKQQEEFLMPLHFSIFCYIIFTSNQLAKASHKASPDLWKRKQILPLVEELQSIMDIFAIYLCLSGCRNLHCSHMQHMFFISHSLKVLYD